MPRYSATLHAAADPATVFADLARFDRAAEWDPGVRAGEMLGGEPVGMGSRFRLEARFLGRSLPLVYEIVEFRAPERVVLRAETAAIRSIDTITFSPEGTGTLVRYDAVLEAKGVGRLFHPALAVVFRRIGDRAAAGLRARLGSVPSW